MLQRKSVRYGAMAAAAAIALAVINLWPASVPKPSNEGSWIMSPAWAQEVREAVGTIKAVTCRAELFTLGADGSRRSSGIHAKWYFSRNSYRLDLYEGQQLREVQWHTPREGPSSAVGLPSEFISVDFDRKTYSVVATRTGYGSEDPVGRMRRLASLIDQADRVLAPDVIEGRNCVGFEIRLSRFDEFVPVNRIDRIWFDTLTNLPVRIEKELQRSPDWPTSITTLWVDDQFDYTPVLPDDLFVPQIPAGFAKLGEVPSSEPASTPPATSAEPRTAATAFWALIVAGQDAEAAAMATPSFAPQVREMRRLRSQADLALGRVEEVYADRGEAFAVTSFFPSRAAGPRMAIGIWLLRRPGSPWQIREMAVMQNEQDKQRFVEEFRQRTDAKSVENVEPVR